PYIAVNWFNETWQLYNINFDCSAVRPISILPDSNSFEIFTYSPGFIDNSSNIFLTRFVNSSYFETETIAEFQGNIIFHQDSIFKTSDGNYFFLYNRRTFESSMQTDLYLSYYDGHSFVETQLTDTPNFVEYYAHAELGEEYLHIAWTQFDLPDDDLLERETGKIFYNRIKISDIVERDINMHMAINNEHIFNSLNPLNIFSSSYHQQIFFAFDLKIVCLMNVYIQKQEVLEYDFCN
ncbi:MAG: hypothetical protein KGD64_12040, partial [Candidatus Heimdallarchaeota archaeon]|nr:hypothetical protein [Candidatus Heimdallarchaeota archaeon]